MPLYGDIPMNSKDRIIGCIAVEEAAASVYKTLMGVFPNEKDFWEGLYKDEIDHSSFLTDADSVEFFESGPAGITLPTKPFINKTLEYAQFLNRHIRYNPVSFEDALGMTLKLEESMVETFTNELMADANLEYKTSSGRDFEKILLEERGHISKLKNMMIKMGYLKVS